MVTRSKLLIAAALLLLAPAMASAQFIAGIGNPLHGFPFSNPYVSMGWGAQRSFVFNTPQFGTIAAGRAYYGSATGYAAFYNRVPYQYYAVYRNYIPQTSSMGAVAPAFKAPMVNQGVIANAQMQAMRNEPEARKLVFDQWAYEKLGVQNLKDPALKNEPEEVRKALTASTEAEVASGEMLNNILVASLALEKKGMKTTGVALPPDLLSKVRFTGTPSGEALNLLRAAGNLPFPSLFAEDKMRLVKDEIEKAMVAVAATASTGKAIDQLRVARLSDSVQRARERITPVARNLPFEDAIAARRFLNDLDAIGKLLQDSKMAGLVDPRWATEGVTVPDLVKHMSKYKLLFGPAQNDGAEAYLALQRGLAAYHASLGRQVAKK